MTTRRTLAYVLALVSTLLIIPATLTAQPRGSERSTVKQIVNGTSIMFDFGRPVALGRDNLFGGFEVRIDRFEDRFGGLDV